MCKLHIPKCSSCEYVKPFEKPDDIITCTLYNSVYTVESWCGKHSTQWGEL